RDLVSKVEEELRKYATVDDVVDTYEEVVSFEDYMADAAHPEGNVFTFSSAELGTSTLQFQLHPEILLRWEDEEFLQEVNRRRQEREGEGSSTNPQKGPVAVRSIADSRSGKHAQGLVPMEENELDGEGDMDMSGT
ncbi:unnamed protein product, partial [Symbiodinium microadriaticum]